MAIAEMATGPCVLALDLGTTSVRAMIVGQSGAILGRARHPLAHRYPQPGWLEQDPVEFVDLATQVMIGALADAEVSVDAVSGVGLVSQRSTAIAWDSESGETLAPAIGWQDRRNQERVDEGSYLGS